MRKRILLNKKGSALVQPTPGMLQRYALICHEEALEIVSQRLKKYKSATRKMLWKSIALVTGIMEEPV